jgi:hypothetical protein
MRGKGDHACNRPGAKIDKGGGCAKCEEAGDPLLVLLHPFDSSFDRKVSRLAEHSWVSLTGKQDIPRRLPSHRRAFVNTESLRYGVGIGTDSGRSSASWAWV